MAAIVASSSVKKRCCASADACVDEGAGYLVAKPAQRQIPLLVMHRLRPSNARQQRMDALEGTRRVRRRILVVDDARLTPFRAGIASVEQRTMEREERRGGNGRDHRPPSCRHATRAFSKMRNVATATSMNPSGVWANG